MYKINVTTLEKWHSLVHGDEEVDIAAAIRAYVAPGRVASPAMDVGSAVHAALQGLWDVPGSGLQIAHETNTETPKGSFLWTSNRAPVRRVHIPAALVNPSTLPEVAAWELVCRKVYDTPHGPVLMSGKADGLAADYSHIVEIKTTASIRADVYNLYLESVQPLFYMDSKQVLEMRYYLYEVGYKRSKADPALWLVDSIADPEVLIVGAPADLAARCNSLVSEFADFLHRHKMLDLFTYTGQPDIC